MSIRNWIEEKLESLKADTQVKIANDGNPIEEITIRYKDVYFFIDIDSETEKPTGIFGWSTDPLMNPTVPIREIWTAIPPKTK